jgi:antitoxin MazE
MRSEIAKWGNSLALRLPKPVAADAGFSEGTAVELSVQNGKLIVAPARPKYRLADLLAQITPDNRHEEVDWGAPKGTEEW